MIVNVAVQYVVFSGFFFSKPFRYAKPTDRQSFDREENRIQQTKQIPE
jgi:hypothetical protein